MFSTARHISRRSLTARSSIAGGRNPRWTSGSQSLPIGGRSSFGSRDSFIRAPFPLSPTLRSMTSKTKPAPKSELSSAAAAKTRAGSGKVASATPYIKDRGPVSWPSLFLVGIAAASIVAYYNIERERRLESAMGRVVSSESDGWSPNPEVMAPRKFKLTPYGYFPEQDAWGACKSRRHCLVFTL